MKIFVVPNGDKFICVNSSDKENDAILIAQGARELTQEEIESAGMKGYEHLVCPLNTVVHIDGSVTFTRPLPLSNERIQSQFTFIIQQRLDAFAQTRGYDSIMSAASYANSTNPKFKKEAEKAIKLRDDTWAICYAIVDAVTAGERSIPTLNELISELPELTWD